jgi:hypothetical protein
MKFHGPQSSDRFHARLAQREGFAFAPRAVTATYCQLFDSAIGGSGPTSNQTTQTTSGNARGVAGGRNQYTESGAISVGAKGKYIESGALDLSGQKIAVGKGASLTINQAPQGSQPTQLSSVDTPGSSAGSPGPVTPPATPPASTDTTQPGASQSTGLFDKLKTFWGNFSIWQKLGAAAVLVLLGWLIFHKRR